MSRRVQKKVPTAGDGNGLEATPFAGLDDLTEGIALKKTPSSSKNTERPAGNGKKAAKVKSQGRVEMRREKAGRGGKTVTTLRGFPSHMPLETLETVVFDLKKRCACGGTLKGRDIELQGDVCQKVREILSSRGYRVVHAGG
ncbi:MAG: translation initiation factor [Verrucomicrobia bacterium]|jgi:translation initiation factor 1|nr:translation initiation factor [Verrucomicrobiota bacterium]